MNTDSFGDVHLYNDHVDLAQKQLERECYPLPQVKLNTAIDNIFSFDYEDIRLEDYKCHPLIRAKVSV